jgi:cardiolipin synthase
MARIHGPGALHVQTVFLDDWCRETGECPDPEVLLPEPDHPGDVTLQTLWWGPDDTHPSYVRTLLALIGNARERIDVCSPYFVPDEPIHLALQVAAERGVQVNVILPMKSDKFYVDAAARAGFDALLEAGVRIHRHRGGVLHAKSVSVDDALALVGSGNCDQRSFYLDYELAILIYDAAIAKRVRDIHEGYLADSERVDLEAWKQRSEWRVTADRMLALLSPLL